MRSRITTFEQTTQQIVSELQATMMNEDVGEARQALETQRPKPVSEAAAVLRQCLQQRQHFQQYEGQMRSKKNHEFRAAAAKSAS